MRKISGGDHCWAFGSKAQCLADFEDSLRYMDPLRDLMKLYHVRGNHDATVRSTWELDTGYTMPYDEVQAAYNDYNNNGWKNMSEENKLILQENGYVYDDKVDMVRNEKGYYRWGGAAPLNRVVAKYKVGEALTEEDLLILINGGYEFVGDILYYNGKPV